MARYIDADALSEEIDKAQMSLASNDDIVWERNKKYYKGLCWARSLVNDQPTADVAPRADVVRDFAKFLIDKSKNVEIHVDEICDLVVEYTEDSP